MDLQLVLQYGGFATLGLVMAYAARMMFESWKKGDLISRDVWQRTEARADTMATQLERNTEALEAHTATMGRVVAAAERQAKASEVQAEAMRELVKRLPPEAKP